MAEAASGTVGAVLLGLPGSGLVSRLAAALESRGSSVRVLSLDAPLEGAPVTVRGGRVDWEGVDPARAAAVFVERMPFPWPQPQRLRLDAGTSVPVEKQAAIEREARALTVSGLRIFATAGTDGSDLVPPTVALDRAASAELPVAPWSVAPAPADPPGDGTVLVDAAGRDRWHEPEPPPPGEPALRLGPIVGDVQTVLVLERTVIGSASHSDLTGWAAGESPIAYRLAGEVTEAAAALAGRAAAALPAGRLAATVAAPATASDPSELAILHLDPNPDLDAWDLALDGAVVESLVESLLTRTGRSPVNANQGEAR